MRELTSKTATELSTMLAASEVTSEEVTRAHLDRIEIVDRRLGAFTEVLRDEALAAARRADVERGRGEARGPLHGMPISVKESLDFAGHASTLGVVSRQAHAAREDAGVIEVARRAGAVVLGRTNVSQLLLFHESRNPIFGETKNPWSLDHTPGGSSGGEAAAIAAGLAPLGIGTDIGGSIRVPAHFAGISGLKPTLDRWTNKGSNSALIGQEAVRSQLGPMARTARDVALFWRAMDPKLMSSIDPRVPPLDAGDPASVDLAKLRIGFYLEGGIVKSSLAVRRAVETAANALRPICASVSEVRFSGIDDAIFKYFGALSADGGEAVQRALEGSEIDRVLGSLRSASQMGSGMRRLASAAAAAAGQKNLGRVLSMLGEKSVAEMWSITAGLRSARSALLDQMRDAGIDVVLCPVHSTPALPHGLSRDFLLAGAASMIWNIAQFPAGVIPVTRVRSDEATRGRALDRLEARAREVDKKSAGLPVGVQVVARPWEEDRVLAVMIAIEDALASVTDRPRTPFFAG